LCADSLVAFQTSKLTSRCWRRLKVPWSEINRTDITRYFILIHMQEVWPFWAQCEILLILVGASSQLVQGFGSSFYGTCSIFFLQVSFSVVSQEFLRYLGIWSANVFNNFFLIFLSDFSFGFLWIDRFIFYSVLFLTSFWAHSKRRKCGQLLKSKRSVETIYSPSVICGSGCEFYIASNIA
jgi:hypothetical protein